ncbi:MAG: Flp pilus assembly protein CpaB [Bradyrhizobium sp.]|nr:Flp pilus assembly protein CpaB [Bradyrhizobium sp.]
MRTSSIILSIAAVVMGAIASLLVLSWLRSQSHEATREVRGTIVVAAAQLGLGVTLTEDNLAEIAWAATTLPEGAFATKHELLKDGRRVVLASLERNEPVLRGKITLPGQPGSLSSVLEDGKRAVTVRVDDVRGVAGFIRPNDRVDVVLIRTEGNSNASSYSDLILQQVKVLAVDQLTGERNEQATVAKAVTLEVTAVEAQKVLLATNIGKLSLILRQAGPGSPEENRRVTERDLAAQAELPPPPQKKLPADPPPPPPAAIPARRSDTATVSILRGLKREEYTVMQDGRLRE